MGRDSLQILRMYLQGEGYGIRNIGSFTAYGMTVDGRMKPDVMSLGSGVLTIDVNGNVVIKKRDIVCKSYPCVD